MDIILADSRGKHPLIQYLYEQHPSPQHLQIEARSGASLEILVRKAIAILRSVPDPSRYHIYFLGGICDITCMHKDHMGWDRETGKALFYEEVTFTEPVEQAVPRYQNLIENISAEIIKLGAKPCFMTVPPSSIETWNTARFNQGITTHLLHYNHYKDMQPNLVRAIQGINYAIISLNIKNNMITPKIADNIMTSPGKNKPPRVHYSRMSDGVHPDKTIKLSWAAKIIHSIKENRKSDVPIPAKIDPPSASDPDSESDTEQIPRKRKWLS